MIQIGRLAVKIAGRDAGKKCVIVDILDNKFVLIDGETRRRKCNIMHLELLDQTLDVKKNASHGDVAKALKEIGIDARETKPKQKTQKPKKKRKTSEQLRAQKEDKKKIKVSKPKKKEEKKESIESKIAPAETEEDKKKKKEAKARSTATPA